MKDKTFDKDFVYKHRNPYHDKLEEFDDFVLRDNEAEAFKGKWNTDLFDHDQPICLEIGSGYGHFMVEFCGNNPDLNFVGMDYRFKRAFTLAKKLNKLPKNNFKYLRARGERIQHMFADGEVDRLFYFFPDPWPKARHNKKRLFQEPFLENAYEVLKPGGKIFCKTDHDDYAEWMFEFIEKTELFELEYKTHDLWKDENANEFLTSFKTKFEKIFIEKNTPIKGFVLRSKKNNTV